MTVDGRPGLLPFRHVYRGSGFPVGGAAVPERELANVRVKVTGPEKSEAHGKLRSVAIKDVVVHICVRSGKSDLSGGLCAPMEALHPPGPRGCDRMADELLEVEREDGVQLTAASQKRLGPHDVTTACQRSVGIPDFVPGEFGRDHSLHPTLGLGGESALGSCLRDSVPAIVGNRRAGEDAEEVLVGPGDRAYGAQLPTSSSHRPEVTVGRCRGAAQGFGRRGLIPEYQMGLGLAGKRVVGVAISFRRQVQYLSGKRASTSPVPRQ